MRDVGWPGIIAAVAVVWVIAALTEYSLSRPRRSMPARAPAGEPAPEPQPMLPREPVPYAVPIAVAAARAPEEDTAAPQVPAAPPEDHTAPAEALAPPQVREAEPEPEPEPAPEPQRWNIWDLERSMRDNGEVSEEQEFLLLYLRA